ncbi:hypothetical protein NXW09_02500 [Bacteroides ovatus]|nr:hypothetical protein [Bacteroides ovatus]
MNKIISLLLVGVLAAGVTTAHAESPIFKKEEKERKDGNGADCDQRLYREWHDGIPQTLKRRQDNRRNVQDTYRQG